MDTNKSNRTEDILNSLDDCQKAAAPPYFYTRLKARMEKAILPEKERSWVLRPVYALTMLVLVLLINAAVVFNGNNNKEKAAADTDSIQSLASEYSLNDNSALVDLNQER